ncbi:hypothetical protein BDN71DRAFT_1429168 [Pleurotus eryngii]|uniref:Uncharacterized protein n=1 Tax=Pleurotus eryngii TaxID=5323 RepID=A0A9P6DAZ4_PLEER|nr:hypothetical protein BDN71DRAFT_1429168 [Pleurotus eryngii]
MVHLLPPLTSTIIHAYSGVLGHIDTRQALRAQERLRGYLGFLPRKYTLLSNNRRRCHEIWPFPLHPAPHTSPALTSRRRPMKISDIIGVKCGGIDCHTFEDTLPFHRGKRPSQLLCLASLMCCDVEGVTTSKGDVQVDLTQQLKLVVGGIEKSISVLDGDRDYTHRDHRWPSDASVVVSEGRIYSQNSGMVQSVDTVRIPRDKKELKQAPWLGNASGNYRLDIRTIDPVLLQDGMGCFDEFDGVESGPYAGLSSRHWAALSPSNVRN